MSKESSQKGFPLPENKDLEPPHPQQQQEHPGSESELSPKADHGEHSYRGHDRLRGKVALITGGDSGIGRATAIAFAREGASVAFAYLSEDDDARETLQWLEETGVECEAFRMDQSSETACRKLVDDVLERFGAIDILINNAGFQQSYKTLDDIPEEEFDYAFRTNVYGTFFLSRAALPHISPGGSIIISASIQSYDPTPMLVPYAATKAALANLAVSFAQIAADRGVRVNAVAPGPVWTPLIPSTLPEGKVENFGKNTLFGRPAQPAELAPVYVFLASDEASYVSGEVYGVTGGRKQV